MRREERWGCARERAVRGEPFEEGGLDAEVGVENVAPLAVHEVHRARIVTGGEVCLELSKHRGISELGHGK